jgi:hypothetical protein
MLSLHFLFRFAVAAGIAAIGIMVWVRLLHKAVRGLIPFAILIWGVPSSFIGVIPQVVVYVDHQGNSSSLTVSSYLLAVVFVVVMTREPAFVGRFLRTPIFLAFYVLFASAFISQAWYLGIWTGLGLAYIRVLQPMMVVVLLAYLAVDEEGLRMAFLSLIGAAAVAIVGRYTAGAALGAGTVSAIDNGTGGAPRVFSLGSWTIYGTICASIVSLIVALVATERRALVRIVLVAAAVFTVKEVLATGTRGALIGLAAVGVFSMRRRARWWMLGVILIVAMAAVAFHFHGEFTGSRALSLDVHSVIGERNTQVRLKRNAAAISYIVAHPLSGSALGVRHLVERQEIGTWVYNPYLAWGTAMGLPALLSFTAIMLFTIGYSIGNWRKASGSWRTMQVGLAAALGVWLINQFTTGDSLTYLQSVDATFFFYAIVGLILGSHLSLTWHRLPLGGGVA